MPNAHVDRIMRAKGTSNDARKLRSTKFRNKNLQAVRNKKINKLKPSVAPKVFPVKEKVLKESSDLRKIEFGCPKCTLTFLDYFVAYKHIQKYHCINDQGQEVAPNSPRIVKPVRLDVCVKCNNEISPKKVHECTSVKAMTVQTPTYKCLGCDQAFTSMQMFDLHLAGLHSESQEVLLFNERKEFLSWKNKMEEITKTKYLILSKIQNQEIFRCSHLPSANVESTTSYYCPSSVILQKSINGLEIQFLKQHYGHDCVDYVLPETYHKNVRNYSDTDKFANMKIDDSDLYVQFKKTMDNIVIDAAKVNITTLQLLQKKAEEFKTILSAYDENDDDDDNNAKVVNKTMTDEQISVALMQKRKTPESPKHEVKRKKSNLKISDNSEENSNKVQTLNGVKNTKQETNINPQKIQPQPIVPSPVSFNDSYKDFIDKNIKKETTPIKTYRRSVPQRKYSVNNTPAVGTVDVGNTKPISKILNEVVIKENPEIKREITPVNESVVPQIINDVQKGIKSQSLPVAQENKREIISLQTIKKATPSFKKKVIMKTKIGQFKPSLSPRNTKSEEAPTKVGHAKQIARKCKPDVEYEVKEQENDCNILILKI